MTSAVTNFRCHKLIAKVNKQKDSHLKNFIYNQCGDKLAKLEATKMQFVRIFFQICWICRTFEFLISQGSLATCLRWGGYCRMVFVKTLYAFQRCKYFENQLRSDKVTQSSKVGTTLCLKKKLPTFKLSVTLSNLNRFSKFLHHWKAYEICYKTHMTLLTSP